MAQNRLDDIGAQLALFHSIDWQLPKSIDYFADLILISMSYSYTRKKEWFLSHRNVRRETKEHMHTKQNLAKKKCGLNKLHYLKLLFSMGWW